MSSTLRDSPLVVLILVLFIAGCGNRAEEESSNAPRPNIVLIVADDLGYGDLGSYGQSKIQTPTLDRMAATGMRFTEFYSGSTVCAPSRSVLMTGRHTGHTSIRGNEGVMPIGQHPLPDSAVTVAEVLTEAGYQTGAFGKWGLGAPGSEGLPSRQGFDTFFGYLGQRRAHFYYPEFLFRDSVGQGVRRVPLAGNEVDDTAPKGFQHPGSGPPKSRGTYSQEAIVREALTFLDRRAGTEAPFFLYMPLTIPHASIIAPEEAMDPYLDGHGESIFPEEPFPGDHYTGQPQPRAAYAAMVTLLDEYVGRVMEQLQDRGIAENTLVLFTSDNGPHSEGGHDPSYFNSAGPLRGMKRDLYEGGIRVPLIAWWPGSVQAGTTSDHISAFEDFLPTFAELAGASTPAATDGLSIVPTLLGQGTQPEREYLYWEFPAHGGKQAVRKGPWKAVRTGLEENPSVPLELYNLEEDLAEQNNVADEHPDLVREIRRIMDEAHTPSDLFPLLEDR